MIYINGEEVKPYLGDYKPLTIYKGTEKLAGWVENTISGIGNIQIKNGYSTMKVKPFGKSEQVQTEQSANLADADVLYRQMEEFDNTDLAEIKIDNKNCIKFRNDLYRDSVGFRGLNNIKYKENTQYTIRGLFRLNDVSQLEASLSLYISYSDGSNSFVKPTIRNDWTEFRILTEQNKTPSYISFGYGKGGLWLLDKDSLCIAEGNVTEYPAFTPDSPSPDYPSSIENVSGDLEVKVVGKNLFNYNSEETNFGSTYATKEQISNGYKMTATITGGAQRCQLIIPMEILTVGKKYTLSYKSDFNPTKIRVGDASGIGDTTGYDKYGSFNNVTTGKITFTLTEKSKKYLIFALYNANAQTGDTYSIWNIQVEYSETATELEEYKEQAVTFPLGEQKLMKDGYLGDDGIHNKRIQIVLTGNENWTLSGRQFEKCACFHVGIDNNTKINMICNAFKYNQMAYNNRIDEECITNNVRTGSQNLIIVQIDKTRLTTQDVNGFKTWLVEQYSAGTPVIVEYELEEEETTVYTSEQQTAYNELQNLKTYRTVTNISNNQNTNMEIAYKNNT